MSNSCDSKFWSYSVNEKRLFTLLLVLFVSLSLFYFNSYKRQDLIVRQQIEIYANNNATNLRRLQTNLETENALIEQKTDNLISENINDHSIETNNSLPK